METEKGSPAENRTSHASRFKGGGIITKNVKDNCKRYIANPDNQTFADFLATQFPTDEGKYFYGGNFWRIPFNDRLKELQNDCNF